MAKSRRYAEGGDVPPPAKSKSILDRAGEALVGLPRRFMTPNGAAPTRQRPQSLPDDDTVVNPNARRPSPTTQGWPGRQHDENIMNAIDAQSEGRAPGDGMKKGGMPKKSGGKPGGGLGALAALQGAMAGGGAGGPPMGPPPGAGGPPMGPPPGAGGPPPMPGMKRGGKVKRMNTGGKPHEDMPLRAAKRHAKELTTERGIQHEEKGTGQGAMKYAKGGKVAHHGPHGLGDETFERHSPWSGKHGHGSAVNGQGTIKEVNKAHSDHVRGHKFAKGGLAGAGTTPLTVKGRKLDKADGGVTKEEKGKQSGEMKYAKGGHVSTFKAGGHGIESKGRTKGKYC